MRKIIVTENVSLDGVMQAPGRPDEDTRDGFTRGGWAVPYNDPVMGRNMGEGMASTGALLLGRRPAGRAAADRQRHHDHRRGDRPLRAGLTGGPRPGLRHGGGGRAAAHPGAQPVDGVAEHRAGHRQQRAGPHHGQVLGR